MSADGVEAAEALPGSEDGSRSTQPPIPRPPRSAVRPGPPASLGVAIRATAIGLVLAYLLKEPCTTHGWADFFQYRHLCYNDIQPLFHARGIDRALVPYRDIQVEYPVLIGAFMYATGRLLSLLVHLGVAPSYNDPAYFQLSALALAPFSLAVTLLLRRRVTARRLMIWAVGTPTVLYSFLNWDLLAVAAMVWGLVEVERRRWGLAGLALALGTSAKLFPGFLVPGAFLAALSIGDRRGGRRFVAAFAGALVVVNVPWMIASFSRWMGIWKFHAARYPDFGTVWFWVGMLGNRLTPSVWWSLNTGYGRFMGGAGLATFALVSCIVLWVGWQRRSEPEGYPVASTGLAIIAAFLVLSKVHSPQYALWVAPLLAMLDIPWWQVFAYMGADLLLFVSAFYWFTELSAPTSGWETTFEAAVFARGAVLLVMSVTAMKSARRLLPGGPAARPPLADPRLREDFFPTSSE